MYIYSTLYIYMYVRIHCILFQYRAYVTVNLSCGLLDVRVSSDVVDLVSGVVHTVTELIGAQV